MARLYRRIISRKRLWGIGKNIVHCLSLSKAGLPGERIGIAIGDENIIEVLENFQPNLCIHSPRYGQAIATLAIRSGKLAEISEKVIRPFYQKKIESLGEILDQVMNPNIPWFLHKGEGSMFGWLWFKDLPITHWELYQEFKKMGVICVPGYSFFPGLKEPLAQPKQCLRMSLTASDREIETALKHLAQVIEKVYS